MLLFGRCTQNTSAQEPGLGEGEAHLLPFNFGDVHVANKVTETCLFASYGKPACLRETTSCNKVRLEIFSSKEVY